MTTPFGSFVLAKTESNGWEYPAEVEVEVNALETAIAVLQARASMLKGNAEDDGTAKKTEEKTTYTLRFTAAKPEATQ